MPSFVAPNGAFVGVDTFPDRKKPCLTIGQSNEYCAQIISLASFKDQESADAFLAFLTDCHEFGFAKAVSRLIKEDKK